MRIRPYQPDDLPALAGIYREAATAAGAHGAYSQEEAAAWAAKAEDLSAFENLVEQGVTLVAESTDGEAVAFGQLRPPDRISLLYTDPGYARASYASGIYRLLEDRARAQGAEVLHTASSLVARPFFEKQGFELVGTEQVKQRGVTFERLRMTKLLREPAGPGA